MALSAFAVPAASADTIGAFACDAPRDVYVPGGEAHWTECHNGGRTTVDGWVKDTRSDGKCAQVYARFSNNAHRESGRACPSGNIKEFHWNEAASDASVYLRTVG